MEKCLFVYNPFSGKGKIKRNENKIRKMLEKKYEVDIIPSKYQGHIYEIVTTVGKNYDLIITSGGDGTLNETVNALCHLDKKIPLGYIPAGTVNDVAHSLCIPRSIKGAVKNILNGQIFSHDVLKINNNYGIYVCCTGIFTETSYATAQNAKKKIGKSAYVFHGLKKVFSTPAVKLKITSQTEEIEGKYAIMLILNSRYVGGFRVNKNANLSDGKVDILLIESDNDMVKLSAINKLAIFFIKGFGKKMIRGTKHFKFLQIA